MESDSLVAVGGILYLLFILTFIGAMFALTGLWIWMLIDCIKYEKDEGNEKLIWILLLIFLNWLGALLYFFMRRRKRISEEPPANNHT